MPGYPGGGGYQPPPGYQQQGGFPGQPGQPGYPGQYGYLPSQRELQVGMWSHLAPLLAGIGISILSGISGGLLGLLVLFIWVIPLVIRENQGRQSAYIRWHSTESLNFQLTLLGAFVISGILIFVLIGILLMAVVGIFALVVLIIATMKANQGVWYRYPISIRFVK